MARPGATGDPSDYLFPSVPRNPVGPAGGSELPHAAPPGGAPAVTPIDPAIRPGRGLPD